MYTTRFLDELERLAASLARDEPAVAFRFDRSPTDRPKQSAWLNFEVGEVYGELIVWESGESERHVGSQTRELVPQTTELLDSPESVAPIVLELLRLAKSEASSRR